MRKSTVAGVGLVAVATMLAVTTEQTANQGASFVSGYDAAPAPEFIRSAMTRRGATAETFCATLFARALASSGPRDLVESDFVDGCKRAVAEAME